MNEAQILFLKHPDIKAKNDLRGCDESRSCKTYSRAIYSSIYFVGLTGIPFKNTW